MSETYRLGKSKIAFIIIFFGLAVVAKAWQYYWPSANVQLAGVNLSVLVAKTPDHQERGLGGRDSLSPYDGMLFLFNEPKKYAFVMRDMRFPIDIVWFFDGKVVDMAPNVPTEPGATEESLRRYLPRKPATLVLELPAGWVKKNNLKIGDSMNVAE